MSSGGGEGRKETGSKYSKKEMEDKSPRNRLPGQTAQRAEGWKGLKAVRCSSADSPAHIKVGETCLTMPLVLPFESGLN